MDIKKISISEQVTYSTLFLKSYYNGKLISTGTGFIINLCNKEGKCRPVIITNKHVIDPRCEIEFEFCKKNDDGSPNDQKTVIIRSKNRWIPHPDKNIDLCCLPIARLVNELHKQKNEIFYIPLNPDLIPNDNDVADLSALEDVVMVGYPKGIIDEYNHKPILRKGVTGTHIKNDYLGMPTFLVDISCLEGSSGSPVFILNEGAFISKKGICMSPRVMLIGVIYQSIKYSEIGQTFVINQSNQYAKTYLPTNIGIAIKSKKILDFEQIFYKSEKMIEEQKSENKTSNSNKE